MLFHLKEQHLKVNATYLPKGENKIRIGLLILFWVRTSREETSRKKGNNGRHIKEFCKDNQDLLWSHWRHDTMEKDNKRVTKSQDVCGWQGPTIEEVEKIIQYPDRRIKTIVYTMVSSRIRAGAWDYLKWGSIVPINKNINPLPKWKSCLYISYLLKSGRYGIVRNVIIFIKWQWES